MFPAGVEVWIEAQQHLAGGASDVPAVARAVCEGITPEGAVIQGQDLHDLLHLAFNSSSPAAATAAVGLALHLPQADADQAADLPADLPMDEALALLQTAVERHSPNKPDVLPEMVGYLEIYDNLAVVQLLPVLLRAMELDAGVPLAAREPDPYLPELRLWHLSTLTVFEELPPDAAAGLLATALKAGDKRSVALLWNSVSAITAIEPARLAELLQVAAAAGDVFSLRLLARCPAFHEVTAAALEAAMMPAVKAGHESCVSVLLDSKAAAPPIASQIGEGYWLLHGLLLAAVQADRPSMVTYLADRSVVGVKWHALMPLLQAALQHSPASFMCLFAEPAAAKIGAKELGQLLRTAARWFRHGIVYEVLNWHRAWGSVSPENKLEQQAR
ncbi:hypothetical protein OEZ86_009691 [Tetradesmus obliquus]|uniref:Nucleolar pre-ribosomal-associated protein 1 C-terminal domain-containing protein n=1 Tax=Tetradesmus obliquus TaxID=3088 RepID=A0ABY8UQS8_TETOB|nr:hypothetical protein OEZ85_001135 [Tetradesmus obliquus]WIA43180.1 hypothetical protein OEZ86_009691 [Tetradesmus obliquus]